MPLTLLAWERPCQLDPSLLSEYVPRFPLSSSFPREAGLAPALLACRHRVRTAVLSGLWRGATGCFHHLLPVFSLSAQS